jgi:hypothetical protein
MISKKPTNAYFVPTNHRDEVSVPYYLCASTADMPDAPQTSQGKGNDGASTGVRLVVDDVSNPRTGEWPLYAGDRLAPAVSGDRTDDPAGDTQG